MSKTNAGEYFAGAYYTMCLDAWPVVYNQPLYYNDPQPSAVWVGNDKIDLNWTTEDIQALAGEDFHIGKAEIDVVAMNAYIPGLETTGDLYIAECSESFTLTRTFDDIRRKFLVATIFAHHRTGEDNLNLELWAPNIPATILQQLPALQDELMVRYKTMGEGHGSLSLTAVYENEYKKRLQQLADMAKDDTSNKLDNPFYRALQMIHRAGITL